MTTSPMLCGVTNTESVDPVDVLFHTEDDDEFSFTPRELMLMSGWQCNPVEMEDDNTLSKRMFNHHSDSEQDNYCINPLHRFIGSDILEAFIIKGGADDAKKVFFRCKHCKHLPSKGRARNHTVCPESIRGIYRSIVVRFQQHHIEYDCSSFFVFLPWCTNRKLNHISLCHRQCPLIPINVKREYTRLKEECNTHRGKKTYWESSAKGIGLKDSKHGIIYTGQQI